MTLSYVTKIFPLHVVYNMHEIEPILVHTRWWIK